MLAQASMFIKQVKTNPLETWTSEQQARLREVLQPVAAGLWPEKFSETKTPEANAPRVAIAMARAF